MIVWSGGSLYYLGENGVLTGGIQKVGDKLRYFDKNGKLSVVSFSGYVRRMSPETLEIFESLFA